MATKYINSITYGSDEYKFVDDSSGYTKNTGTVEDVQVNGTSIISSGVANLVTNTAYNASSNKIATMSDVGSMGGGTVTSVGISGTSPINASGTVTSSGTLSVSHANSGVTAGTYGSATTTPVITVNATGHVTGVTNTTISGVTPASHTHGNITNDGDITATATIATGDRLVINDESASEITNSSITFDTTEGLGQFLKIDGTWGDAPQSVTDVQLNGVSVLGVEEDGVADIQAVTSIEDTSTTATGSVSVKTINGVSLIGSGNITIGNDQSTTNTSIIGNWTIQDDTDSSGNPILNFF